MTIQDTTIPIMAMDKAMMITVVILYTNIFFIEPLTFKTQALMFMVYYFFFFTLKQAISYENPFSLC